MCVSACVCVRVCACMVPSQFPVACRYAASCLSTGHQELLQRMTVPYAACIQLCPPEDEHLMLEIFRGEEYFMNK